MPSDVAGQAAAADEAALGGVPDLHVETLGEGPAVLLVHGDVATGATAWRRQRPLAARWRLVVPDRPWYGRSPAQGRVDFTREADVLARVVEPGSHVVGHSYGAVVAMEVATRVPVRSLTLVEPPALGLTDAPAAVALRRWLEDLWSAGSRTRSRSSTASPALWASGPGRGPRCRPTWRPACEPSWASACRGRPRPTSRRCA